MQGRTIPLFPDPDAISSRFDAFHAEHPEVYAELVKRARQLKAKGIHSYSIKGLYEIVRFHTALGSTTDQFKLNNDFTAHYARLIMQQEDGLAGFFKLRVRRTA